jgi:hypothetical protein
MNRGMRAPTEYELIAAASSLRSVSTLYSMHCCRSARPRQAGPLLPSLCRFSAAGNDETLPALKRPAVEKRQGTKSREVGH